MPSPDLRSLHVSTPLTNLSVAFIQSQDRYFADRVFPVVGVQKQGDLFYTYDKGSWYRTMADVRAPATESKGDGWEVTTDNYYAPVYAVHKDISDQHRANADTQLRLDSDATEWTTQMMLLKRDQLFVSSFLTTGVWGLDRAGVASGPTGSQFIRFDAAGSTPIQLINGEVNRMDELTGYRPNVLVMGPYVETALLNHADVLDRIKYTERGIASDDLLASLFGVDRVVVARSIQNTAVRGATASMSYMMGKSMLLAYAAPNAGLLQPSAGYILAWTGFLGSGAYGIRMKRFRLEPIESDRIEAEMAFSMKKISADMGTFFTACVS